MTPRRRRARGLRHLAAALLPLLLGACAQMAPPPGGPPDLTPPRILSARPDSMATGVDPDSGIVLNFSEKVDRTTVREWVFLNPYRPLAEVGWQGTSVRLRYRGGLPPDTTVSLVVGSGIVDRAGNPLTGGFRRLFATGDRVSPGVLTGRIRRTRTAAAPPAGPGTTTPGQPPAPPGDTGAPPGTSAGAPRFAMFVWLFRAQGDTLPDPVRETPDWVAEADPDGRFVLEGLPVDVPFLLFALFDGDRSRGPGSSRDYLQLHPDTLRLSAAAPQLADLDLLLIDPKSPGAILGRLEAGADDDTTAGAAPADTIRTGALAALRPVEVDSLAMTWPPLSPARQALVDSTGSYALRPLPAGRYRVAAFLDRNRSGQWDRDEPLGPWREVDLAPAAEVTDLILARPVRPRD